MTPSERYAIALRNCLEAHGLDAAAQGPVCDAWMSEHYPDRLRSAKSYLAANFTVGLANLVAAWRHNHIPT